MTLAQPDHGQSVPAHVPDPAILDLIRRPYVAELLAGLDAQPQTLTELCRRSGARRHVVDGLRALAAHQAITATPFSGSWDSHATPNSTYRLTLAGRVLVEYLFDLDVWRAAYDG